MSKRHKWVKPKKKDIIGINFVPKVIGFIDNKGKNVEVKNE